MNETYGFSTKNSNELLNDVKNISSNRTLLVTKLTHEETQIPEFISEINTIEGVFEYYQPQIPVFFERISGGIKKELFYFSAIKDFNKENLIKQSVFLKGLLAEKSTYLTIIKQLNSNNQLSEKLDDTNFRKKIISLIQLLKEELSQHIKRLNKEVLSHEFLDTTSTIKEIEITSFFEDLTTLIPAVSYLNSNNKVVKDSFLSKDHITKQQQLFNELKYWGVLLENEKTIEEIIKNAFREITEIEDCFQKNIKLLLSETRELEKNYYGITLFFRNCDTNPTNITFLNADLKQLTDLDNDVFFGAVAKELEDYFDRLDLSTSYSLLVIPGFLKTRNVIAKWGKIAYLNKVLFITDFLHLHVPDDVVELYEEAELIGNEAFYSNSIMACNWLVGRGKYVDVNEEDHLYIPPSLALAGKIYGGLLSQASAGKTYGVINGAKGVCFKLQKNDLSALEKRGLIPITFEDGKLIVYASRTLYGGENIGLQSYTIVRVFDYITKVLMDFFNRRTFENFTANIRKELIHEIVGFLNDNTGPEKLISGFNVNRFDQDLKNKNQIHLDINIEPFFPSKNFDLKMNFESNEKEKKWETNYYEIS